MKTRVGLFISSYKKGGAETQFWNLVNSLDRNRFDVHLIQLEHHDQRPARLILPGTHIETIRARFTLSPAAIWAIRRYVLGHRLDLLMSIQFMDNQFARVSGALCGIPVITGVRGELPPILGPFKMFVENRMRIFSDRIVTNSCWMKSKLTSYGWNPAKIIVIYNGIATDKLVCDLDRRGARLKAGIPEDGRVIGIVARLHPMKDHLTYLRMLSRLIERDEKTLGLIVGCGAEENRIRAWVAELGIGDKVRFAGNVTKEIGAWYRTMDIAALTSRYGESFPNVIPEAMACGIPVVATNVSGVGEIIRDGENGFTAPIGDWETLADRAWRLLTDDQLRQEFVEAGMHTVAQLSIPVMVDKFSDLFEAVSGK